MAAGDDRTPIDDVREMVREGVEKLTRERQADADPQEEPGGPGVAVEPERPEPVDGPDGPGGPGDLHEPPSEVDDGAIDGDGRPDLVDGGPPTAEHDGRGAAPGVAADLDPSSPAPSLDGASAEGAGGGPDWSDPAVQDGLTFASEWLEAEGIDTSQLTNQQIADQFGAIVDEAEHELYTEMSEAYLQNEGISTEGMTDQEKIDAAVEHADGVEYQMLVGGSRNYLQQELGIDTEGMTDQQIIDRAQQHLDSVNGNQVPLLEGSVGRAVDAALNGDLDAFTTALGEFGVATERTMFAVTEALNEIAAEIETAVDEALAPEEEEAPPEDEPPDEEGAPPEDEPPEEEEAPPEDETPEEEEEEGGDDDADDADDDAGDDDAGGDEGDDGGGEGENEGSGQGENGGGEGEAEAEAEGEEQTGQPTEPEPDADAAGFTPDDLRAGIEESTRYTEVTRGAERDSRVQYADTPGSETGGTPSTKPHPNPVDPANPEYDKGAPVSADAVRGTIGGNIDPHDDPSGSAGGASPGAPGGAPVPPGGNPVAAEDFGHGAGGVDRLGIDTEVAELGGEELGGEEDPGVVDVDLADDGPEWSPSAGLGAEVEVETDAGDLGGPDAGAEDAM